MSIEVLKRFIERKDESDIISCIETLDGFKKDIGEGKNSKVFTVEDPKILNKVCVKVMEKKPYMICNSSEVECSFQQELLESGVRVPLYIALIKDSNGIESIIMEKIEGASLGDMWIGKSPWPENFNIIEFFSKLEKEILKMHNSGHSGISHRDLHEGNVMIDENNNPVIIDFGTATYGTTEYAYEGFVSLYNESLERYENKSGILRDDLEQLRNLKKRTIEYYSKRNG